MRGERAATVTRLLDPSSGNRLACGVPHVGGSTGTCDLIDVEGALPAQA